MSECAELDEELQEVLGRNIQQSAYGAAGSSIDLINKISQGEEFWPKLFIKGLVTECLVNERLEFRLKGTFLKESLLIALKHPDGINLVNELRANVKNAKASPSCRRQAFDDAMSMITEAASTNLTHKPHLDALISAIEELKTNTDLGNLPIA